MNKKQLTIQNDVTELRKLHLACESMASEWGLSETVSMHINLVLEEAISNILFYGYEDNKEHEILIEFIKEEDEVIIRIIDDGKAFDILATDDFGDVDKSAEDRKIGGLGIHFVKKLMDNVEYTRDIDNNILTLYKKI